jgi:hypothetical protein
MYLCPIDSQCTKGGEKMKAGDKLVELAHRFLRFMDSTLSPEPESGRPEKALVEVRLVELLPPELPGWPSKYPTKHK